MLKAQAAVRLRQPPHAASGKSCRPRPDAGQVRDTDLGRTGAACTSSGRAGGLPALYPYLYIYICLSVYLYLSIDLSIFLSISIYLYLSICLSILVYLSVYLCRAGGSSVCPCRLVQHPARRCARNDADAAVEYGGVAWHQHR